MAIDTKMVCTVNAICKIYKSLSLTFPDGSLGMVELEYIDPIESPEEKAQREEDEFVVVMLDAASQEQLMSAGFKSGVIAAYRKLKGGE